MNTEHTHQNIKPISIDVNKQRPMPKNPTVPPRNAVPYFKDIKEDKKKLYWFEKMNIGIECNVEKYQNYSENWELTNFCWTKVNTRKCLLKSKQLAWYDSNKDIFDMNEKKTQGRTFLMCNQLNMYKSKPNYMSVAQYQSKYSQKLAMEVANSDRFQSLYPVPIDFQNSPLLSNLLIFGMYAYTPSALQYKNQSIVNTSYTELKRLNHSMILNSAQTQFLIHINEYIYHFHQKVWGGQPNSIINDSNDQPGGGVYTIYLGSLTNDYRVAAIKGALNDAEIMTEYNNNHKKTQMVLTCFGLMGNESSTTGGYSHQDYAASGIKGILSVYSFIKFIETQTNN